MLVDFRIGMVLFIITGVGILPWAMNMVERNDIVGAIVLVILWIVILCTTIAGVIHFDRIHIGYNWVMRKFSQWTK